MPVYQLTNELNFPPPQMAEPSGLLAIGGDLSTERLLQAYARGIFPWYSAGDPLLWWSPDPRTIIIPDEFHCSRRLRRLIRQQVYTIRADTAFAEVVEACAGIPRAHEQGTWITPEMQSAYCRLHKAGFAHSIEAWQREELVGGLYGVSLGRGFFGESMFSHTSNASKTALAALVETLASWHYLFIDCQFTTAHLSTLGAREIPRQRYLALLHEAFRHPTGPGLWTASFPTAGEIP
ncbi:MAG: leucyl/phenylalanyl-tRNA--protein transferase [Deltaproteobacteria bacterium]|nr:leucyl/phenylalanyl-tRNA--protein transferase [Candidatus Anaeroferrophillus wilburensis]MBN2890123.1 leucyl/phenylalanyl-tRNA--protein transferase [Deltaproteobacteria bacterium]